ncbi:hypothetical protein [Ponticoccus sp. (in: a-proteobacteria)]|uniref:hypothetical protein n=1 Tax=Ponticoccus sp. (in: a-proteobacteria) TaxID=1925025 RepID=UPI003AB437E0
MRRILHAGFDKAGTTSARTALAVNAARLAPHLRLLGREGLHPGRAAQWPALAESAQQRSNGPLTPLPGTARDAVTNSPAANARPKAGREAACPGLNRSGQTDIRVARIRAMLQIGTGRDGGRAVDSGNQDDDRNADGGKT